MQRLVLHYRPKYQNVKMTNDMKEIYWILRLDDLCTFLEGLVTLSIVVAVVASICIFVVWLSAYDESDEAIISKSKKILIISSITAVLLGLAAAFVPTSKEALIIYGVGGTIDYVQSKETLQQLPDKAVEALDLWVESLKTEELDNDND